MLLPFRHVILPAKEAIERFGEPHEVFINKIFTTGKTEGCTLLMASKLQLMGLDVDGKVHGVYETVEEDQVLVVENHPNLTVFLKEGACKIWKIDGFEFEDVVLSKCITEHYLKEPTLDALNEKFAESSMVSLDGFLQKNSLESINITETVRIGPADYRSFAVLKQVDAVSKLLVSVAFRKYIEDLTGLPLSPATRPPLGRVLEAAGDYQILHGNYSEPVGVDCIFNFYPNQVDGFQWPEETCGRIHYLDEEGTEILEISNASNSLTLVYRTEGVVRFLENVKGTSNQPLFQVLITYPVLE